MDDPAVITTAFKTIDEEYKQILVRDNKAALLKCISEVAAVTPGDQLAPAPADVFAAFQRTPWSKLSVILIGQDPYPTRGDAMGLCFSTGRPNHVPRSLHNIHLALIESKYITDAPTHGDLSSWAAQGVLMLNLALTTQIGNAGAHIEIWKSYVQKIIHDIAEACAQRKRPLVFMLWGAVAKKISYIVDQVNQRTIVAPEETRVIHRVLTWGHPSPLANANKRDPTVEPQHFANCDNFINCNRLLHENGLPQIDWRIPE